VRTAAFPLARERKPVAGRLGPAVLIAKPGIAAGVAVAGLAGMVLAAGGIPSPQFLLPGLGRILLAASGSAILNGIFDAPMDARMPRLAERVAALRQVGKVRALGISLSLVAGGLFLAYRYLNGISALLVLAAVLSYSLLYTLLLKRRSPYGTIPGGIPGALPVLIGYSAVSGRIGPDGWILFLVMLLWQPPHFWALALKYREQYRAAEVPALPAVHGEAYTRVLIFLYAVALLPMSLALWAFGYCSGYYAAAAFLLWAGFLLSSYRNAVASRRYGRAFGASIVYLMLLLFALVGDILLRSL